MVLPKIFSILLFVIYFSHSVIGQNVPIIQPKATTSCPNPNDFPLFGTQCISRELYTGIFLASIMLAGISFLLLIVLFISYCTRRSSSSGSSNVGDDPPSVYPQGSVSSGSIVETPRDNRRQEPRTDVLSKVTGTTPLEAPTQKRANPPSNDYYVRRDRQASSSTSASAAPYTATKPVSKPTKTSAVTHGQFELDAMYPRQSSRLPNQGGRGDRNRNNNTYSDGNKVSTKF